MNMNNKLSITTTEEILRLRNYLQQISHVSYSFSKLNQNYPIDTLNETDAKGLIKAYLNLISETKEIINTFKKGSY